MFWISKVSKQLREKFLRKGYRTAYVAEHVRRGIAHQIRALRDQRGWKQGEFASRLEKSQSVVSRLEDPSYGKLTVQTLLEVASTFDVALQIKFVSYSTFIQQTRDLTTSSMHVPSFDADFGMQSMYVPSINVQMLPAALSSASEIGKVRLDIDTGELDTARLRAVTTGKSHHVDWRVTQHVH